MAHVPVRMLRKTLRMGAVARGLSGTRRGPLGRHARCIAPCVAFDGTPFALVALLVEDDPAAARRTSQALTDLGFSPRVCANAEDALAWLKVNAAPALILVDLTLPRLSGFALCELLREDPSTHAVPTLVLPGKRTMELHDEARALELEVMVVEKPAALPRVVASLFELAPRSARFSLLAFLGA